MEYLKSTAIKTLTVYSILFSIPLFASPNIWVNEWITTPGSPLSEVKPVVAQYAKHSCSIKEDKFYKRSRMLTDDEAAKIANCFVNKGKASVCAHSLFKKDVISKIVSCNETFIQMALRSPHILIQCASLITKTTKDKMRSFVCPVGAVASKIFIIGQGDGFRRGWKFYYTNGSCGDSDDGDKNACREIKPTSLSIFNFGLETSIESNIHLDDSSRYKIKEIPDQENEKGMREASSKAYGK